MKTLALFFAALPLLALCDMSDDVYVVDKLYYFGLTDTSVSSPSKSYTYSTPQSNDFTNIQLFLANQYHGITYYSAYDALNTHVYQAQTSSNPSYKYPALSVSSGKYVGYHNFPLLEFLDSTAAQLVLSGFTIPHTVNSGSPMNSPYDIVCSNAANTVGLNIRSLIVLSTALSSSNLVYRSFVQSSLGSLSSDLRSLLQSATASSSDVSALRSALDSFSANYSAVHYADLLSGSSNGTASFVRENPLFSELSSSDYSDLFGYLSFFDTSAPSDTSVRSMFNAASVPLLADAIRASSLDRSKTFSEYLGNPSSVQSVLSFSYSTPLTNAMKRMTADWRDAVTNELAQNTANITNQLEQWKRDSNLRHNDTTNALDKVGQGVSSVADDAKRVADMLSGSSASKAHVIVDNEFVPVKVLNWPEDLHININANDLDVLANASGVSSGKILDALTNRVDALTNSVASLPVSLDVITNLLAKIDVDMLDNLTNLDFNVSLTNDLWNYYFTRFRRANEFEDENGQRFRVDTAADSIFGSGFDAGEFGNLNWFSRVEVLLYQVGRVFDSTNAIESVDIETALDDTVDQLEEHGADFVAASRRVVGLFSLVDRFAKSMKLAFGSYSNPVTSGILLLPSGSWIGNHALVLEIPVSIQNALRLVFQCIWYLSAFVIGWRVVSSVWSRVVSFVRWLWSLIDV